MVSTIFYVQVQYGYGCLFVLEGFIDKLFAFSLAEPMRDFIQMAFCLLDERIPVGCLSGATPP